MKVVWRVSKANVCTTVCPCMTRLGDGLPILIECVQSPLQNPAMQRLENFKLIELQLHAWYKKNQLTNLFVKIFS